MWSAESQVKKAKMIHSFTHPFIHPSFHPTLQEVIHPASMLHVLTACQAPSSGSIPQVLKGGIECLFLDGRNLTCSHSRACAVMEQ